MKMFLFAACTLGAMLLGSLNPTSAQTKITGKVKGDSTPVKLVNFALSKQGQRLGAGQCTDLVNAALESVGCKQLEIRAPTPDDTAAGWASDAKEVYIWGEIPTPNGRDKYTPHLGDIIQFERCILKAPASFRSIDGVFGPKWELQHHTAIVAYVETGTRKVVLLQQNAPSDSPVRQDYVDLDWLQPGGQIRGFSPTAKSPMGFAASGRAKSGKTSSTPTGQSPAKKSNQKPTITASPAKPILNKDGSSTRGSSTLTYDGGPDHPYVEVWVSVNGADPKKVLEAAGNGKGTRTVTVEAGKKYRFILTDSGKELDSVEMRLSPTATSGATPAPKRAGQ